MPRKPHGHHFGFAPPTSVGHPSRPCGVILTNPTTKKEQSFELFWEFLENIVFDREPAQSYASGMRGNLAKAFELANTKVFRRVALSKSYTDLLGRKLFRALLTMQGLIAFALITLGVILNKFSVAGSVIHPRI